MSAAALFILFVVSSGTLPDFTALASYETAEACSTAAKAVNTALEAGQDAKLAVCFSADSLHAMATSNGLK